MTDAWYKVATSGELTQGDIVPRYPIVIPRFRNNIEAGKEVDLSVIMHDLIVVTASCDLVESQNPNDIVLLCEVDEFQAHLRAHSDKSGQRKGRRKDLLTNKIASLQALPATENLSPKRAASVVRFDRCHTLDREELRKFIDAIDPRLTLCSPYGEFVAQRFATYHARIGLPVGFSLPEAENS